MREYAQLNTITRETPDDEIEHIIGTGALGMSATALLAWQRDRGSRRTYKTTINTQEAAEAGRTKGLLTQSEIQENAKAYFKGLKRVN